jgi:anterior pharynx defective protein 1
MPLFLVTAFTALGFLLLHTFSMVIAFNSLAGDKHFHQLFVPVMHFVLHFW